MDQGEILKFVYNWLTSENGGAAKSNLAPPPKKHAPRLMFQFNHRDFDGSFEGEIKQTTKKFCMTKTILGHTRRYPVSQTDFLGRRRFVRAADPLYRKSWQSDICCFRCMIWPLLHFVLNWKFFTLICKYKLTRSLAWCTGGTPMLLKTLLMLTTLDVFFCSVSSSTSTC